MYIAHALCKVNWHQCAIFRKNLDPDSECMQAFTLHPTDRPMLRNARFRSRILPTARQKCLMLAGISFRW